MRTVRDVAQYLARAHRERDPRTSVIKLVPAESEVRLVEVSPDAPSTGDVLPVRFGSSPADEIDYPSVVVLLSPEEWQDVLEGRLSLPAGWSLSCAEDL